MALTKPACLKRWRRQLLPYKDAFKDDMRAHGQQACHVYLIWDICGACQVRNDEVDRVKRRNIFGDGIHRSEGLIESFTGLRSRRIARNFDLHLHHFRQTLPIPNRPATELPVDSEAVILRETKSLQFKLIHCLARQACLFISILEFCRANFTPVKITMKVSFPINKNFVYLKCIFGVEICNSFSRNGCKKLIYFFLAPKVGAVANTTTDLIVVCNDRVDSTIIGSNHLYYLVNPKNSDKSEGSPDEVDWNYAQKEMAEATGFQTGFGSGLSKGNVWLVQV